MDTLQWCDCKFRSIDFTIIFAIFNSFHKNLNIFSQIFNLVKYLTRLAIRLPMIVVAVDYHTVHEYHASTR
jgi:hypothetical protein